MYMVCTFNIRSLAVFTTTRITCGGLTPALRIVPIFMMEEVIIPELTTTTLLTIVQALPPLAMPCMFTTERIRFPIITTYTQRVNTWCR